MKLLHYFLILLTSLTISAQSIDSYRDQLLSAKGAKRIQLLKSIVEEYRQSKPWEAKRFAELMLKDARRMSDKKEEANALYFLAFINNEQGNFSEAIAHARKAIWVYKKLKNSYAECELLILIGDTHRLMEEYREGIKSLKLAESIAKKHNHKKLLGKIYRKIGVIYYYENQMKGAKRYYEQALELEIEQQNEEGIASINHNLGLLFNREGKYDSAIHYLSKSLRFDQEKENLRGVSVSYLAFTRVYLAKGDHEMALAYANNSLELADSLDSNDLKENIYGLFSYIHMGLNNSEEAIVYSQKQNQLKDRLFEDRLRTQISALNEAKRLDIEALQQKHKEELRSEQQTSMNKINNYKYLALGLGVLILILVFNQFSLKDRLKRQMIATGD